jgi:hypothetical protein
MALLSKMFSLAISLAWRLDHPGVERDIRERRSRYLAADELGARIRPLGILVVIVTAEPTWSQRPHHQRSARA